MKRTTLLACLVLPLAACTDREVPTGPLAQPQSSDADAQIANPHFSFLAPLGSGEVGTGVLNTSLSPVVEICRVEVGATACDNAQPAGFPLQLGMADGGDSGSDGASDNVRLEDDHYIVNWHTGKSGVVAGERYRLSVLPVAGAAPLGHAYILFQLRGGETATEGDIETKAGRALPVKFRIEQGALCQSESGCVEQVVTPEGGVVLFPTGESGVDVPPGAVDGPIVIIVEPAVERFEGLCLPTDLEQVGDCYRFDTEPAIGEVQNDGEDEFNLDVTVGICLDPFPDDDQYQLHQFDPEKPELGVRALPPAQAPFLECDPPSEPIGLLGRAGRTLAQLFGPAELAARDKGLGGLTTSFSNIGWARGLALDILDGDEQSAPVGTQLEIDPTVLVTAMEYDGETAPAVSGVEILFEVVSGGGGISVDEGLVQSLTVITGEDGAASVPWVLGDEPGENTLRASAPGGVDVLFVATAALDGFSLLTVTPSGLLAIDELGNSILLTEEAETNGIEVVGTSIFVRSGDALRELDGAGNLIDAIQLSPTLNPWVDFVALPDGGFALLDNSNDRVHFVDATGALEQTVAMPETSPAEAQVMNAVVQGGRLIISETGGLKLVAVDLTTRVASIFRDFSEDVESGFLGAIEHQDGLFFIARPSEVQTFSEEGALTTLVSFDGNNVVGVEPVGSAVYSLLNFAGELYRTDIATGETELVVGNLSLTEAGREDLEFYPVDVVPDLPPIE